MSRDAVVEAASEPSVSPVTHKLQDELWVRTVSALFLGVLTLLAVYLGSWPFAALVAALSLIVSWEWCRLGGLAPRAGALVFSIIAASSLAAIILVTANRPEWAPVGLAVGATLAGLAVVPKGKGAVMAAGGVLYVGGAGLALTWLRGDGDAGMMAVTFLFLVVWSVDSAALIFGRTFGGWRMFPQISPNKTWAGALGGLLASFWAAAAFALALPAGHVCSLAVIGLALAIATLAGDFFESALKRHFGRKDTSGLIPGHGGVMDRVDGLVFAAMALGLFALIVDASAPAHGLMGWVAPWWRP